jgi:hypothetical protein
MSTPINARSVAIRVLQAGEILTVTADAISSGRTGRLADQNGAVVPDVPTTFTALAAGTTITIGPFPIVTRHHVEALVGQGVAFTQTPGNSAHIEIIGNADQLREIVGAGAPTDGTTGANVADIGSRYTDVTNANLYINAGTRASPTWKLVTRAA